MGNNFDERPAPETVSPTPPPVIAPPAAPGVVEKIITFVHDALKGQPKRVGTDLLNFALLRDIGGQGQIVSADALPKLSDWQKQHDTANQAIDFFTRDNAYQAWLAHRGDLQSCIQSDSLKDKTSRTRQDFEADFERKATVAHRELERIYQECWPLARAVSEAYVALASKAVTAMEESEKAQHDFYGIRYGGPSNLIRAFKMAVRTAEARTQKIEDVGNLSPRQMVGYLEF